MQRICIVATGGTIAGKGAAPRQTASYRAGALGITELCAAVPGLEAEADITVEQFASIDSKDADPDFWQALAVRLQAVLDDSDIDGVVITHGTDTLEETAYYLHLTLKTAKPVVLTGAMRPATALSADGPINLLNAVTVAAHPGARGRGVLVAMNHAVFGAREVAKLDTLRPDAFGAPNTGPQGLVHDGRITWLAASDRAHTMDTRFSPATPLARVDILAAYAGFPIDAIQAARAAGARGLVWAGTGNSTASQAVEAELASVAAAGLAVVRASRVNCGMLVPTESAPGQIWTDSLSPWKARILLMLSIGSRLSRPEIQSVFASY
ncbi:asparaginase [Pusillimonas caeni]|uniref:asparaginase n=1 Tax=Pusillimonas caeni TaxID=1348472 RepID=UPI000E599ACC|nr:asparaginase [Pusillimonas caeni]TFL15646.1 asparaginase [Pusillimonas caeni]